jgi:hypothetical protein
MLTSAKSTPEIRRYCWFDISLLRRQDGAIKADAVFTAINRNELGISLRRAARARNTGRACRYWMNPLRSLFATSDHLPRIRTSGRHWTTHPHTPAATDSGVSSTAVFAKAPPVCALILGRDQKEAVQVGESIAELAI